MIYEHEIPNGTKLYFGKSATLKREIEYRASQVLSSEGFEEILTPFFSLHQHKLIDQKELIRVSDSDNYLISLRSDSSLDVVRLIGKRLKNTDHKKWFYIQPIFKFPTKEIYQIGAELIGDSDISHSINITDKIFNILELNPLLHLSNIEIPKLISQKFNVSIDIFKETNLEEILKIDSKWVKQLLYLQNIDELDEVLKITPKDISAQLLKIKEIAKKINYKNCVIEPLYYANMRYYDGVFFKFISDNSILSRGGSYSSDGINSSGFALYTDEIIEKLI